MNIFIIKTTAQAEPSHYIINKWIYKVLVLPLASSLLDGCNKELQIQLHLKLDKLSRVRLRQWWAARGWWNQWSLNHVSSIDSLFLEEVGLLLKGFLLGGGALRSCRSTAWDGSRWSVFRPTDRTSTTDRVVVWKPILIFHFFKYFC